MALWKEQVPAIKEPAPVVPEPAIRKEPEYRADPAPSYSPPVRAVEQRQQKEALITEGLTIEGKIEGTGNVRVAGKFKGDIHVQGNLVIEPGAVVTGAVRASTVTIGGQLEGNVDGAARVELLETGVLIGDLTADSLTVAAGSRMRGKAEFGWSDKSTRSP